MGVEDSTLIQTVTIPKTHDTISDKIAQKYLPEQKRINLFYMEIKRKAPPYRGGEGGGGRESFGNFKNFRILKSGKISKNQSKVTNLQIKKKISKISKSFYWLNFYKK